jgi:hypothetical protein
MVSSAKSDHLSRLERVISTLGPSGTDSAHEARKHCSNVSLFPSFVAATEHFRLLGGCAS